MFLQVHRLEDPVLETRWSLFDANVLQSLRPVRDECLGGVSGIVPVAHESESYY